MQDVTLAEGKMIFVSFLYDKYTKKKECLC